MGDGVGVDRGECDGVYYYLRIVFAMTKREGAEQERSLPVAWEATFAGMVLGLGLLCLRCIPRRWWIRCGG